MEQTTTTVIQDALERAAAAHGVYEAEVLGGVHHVEWPAWYAEHMTNTLASDGYQLIGTNVIAPNYFALKKSGVAIRQS